METGDTQSSGNERREPAMPPPLPPPDPVDDLRAPSETRWAVAVTLPAANQWHIANKILARHGITGQMRATDSNAYDLLVISTELAWARELLQSSGKLDSVDRPTGGFPVYPEAGAAEGGPAAAPKENPNPSAMRALPVDARFLTREQQTAYSAAIFVLWILLAIVAVLTLIGFIL